MKSLREWIVERDLRKEQMKNPSWSSRQAGCEDCGIKPSVVTPLDGQYLCPRCFRNTSAYLQGRRGKDFGKCRGAATRSQIVYEGGGDVF